MGRIKFYTAENNPWGVHNSIKPKELAYRAKYTIRRNDTNQTLCIWYDPYNISVSNPPRYWWEDNDKLDINHAFIGSMLSGHWVRELLRWRDKIGIETVNPYLIQQKQFGEPKGKIAEFDCSDF